MKRRKGIGEKKLPWVTIIENPAIVICEICKLINPRNKFVVNYLLILSKI
jgi:hypothetical protein